MSDRLTRATTKEQASHGPWRCDKCSSRRWVGWRAGPAPQGYRRQAQCVPCGHVQEFTADEIFRQIAAGVPDEDSER